MIPFVDLFVILFGEFSKFLFDLIRGLLGLS